MGSARDRVFSTTELLEMAISLVNNRDILVNVQRVSKRWRDVIHASPTIRKSLFLLPSPTLLAPHQPYTLTCLTSIIPAFLSTHSFEGGSQRYITRDGRFMMDDIFGNFSSEFKRKWFVENASWRRMLVSQPPIKKIYWCIYRQGRLGTPVLVPKYMAELEFPEGLRMSELYSLLLRAKGYYAIQWPNMACERFSVSDEQAESMAEFERKAREEHAILVKQLTWGDTMDLDVKQEAYLPTSDLQALHKNIKQVEALGVGAAEAQFLSGMDLKIDSVSAMRLLMMVAMARAK
ncbi:uncharacterized protein F4812DRAFT_457911 [Daldinia caldariorum]|uniref:uncharacterized protein n=1 Tax=Daldinia caldariorum TaxID=326644 RepID=UPI002008469C|nr:uncharacterized protein F4812DRAFT_457911 [Daldinia caldariorum]KAI1469373.1 hypothetical protein F4812DRAFT_457911 [Daldinia caldariorum]